MGGDVVSAILDAGQAGILFGTTPEGTVRFDSGRGGLWRLEGAATSDPGDDRWNVLRSEDGLLNNTISALALDSDAALWIGTPLGLLRVTFNETYSGFTSTRSYFKAHGLPGNRILSLAAGDAGRMWVGTDSGLALIEGDRIETIAVEDGLPGNGIRSIAVAPDGAVWVATPSGIGVRR
jgi:ligand-binding sensor domain-containing protein